MTVLHTFPKHKVVYIEVPKTGCTSVKWALRKFRGQYSGQPDADFHAWFGYTHADDIEKKLRETYNDWVKFTIVRNPYDRFRSLFDSLKAGIPHWQTDNVTINDFAKIFHTTKWATDTHGMPQTNMTGIDLFLYDFVGTTEDMPGVFNFLSTAFGEKIESIHENKAISKSEIEPETKALLAQIFRADFDVLPYKE